MTDDAMDPIDGCVANCITECEGQTPEQMLSKISDLIQMPLEQVQEKYQKLRLDGLISEYCHLKCVPDYDPPRAPDDAKGGMSPDVVFDPPAGGG